MHGSSLILNIQMQFTYLVVLHILCDVLKKVHNYRVVKSKKEYICLLILLSFFLEPKDQDSTKVHTKY